MTRLLKILVVAAFAGILACGPGDSSAHKEVEYAKEDNPEGALTEWEVINGMGPVKEPLQLGEIDPALVETGAQVFDTKCSVCHKLDERYVGPPLREVISRRTPEFVMNMILDPTAMVKYHPVIKKLLAQYYTPMTFQNVTREDARAILEYLRQMETEKPEASH